ncbi:MAG: AAA family ATPase [Armatimonadetes bacterium]|nr:AAA family ATPase [Armatimonadota bacterium]MDW8153105.1 AAA family ATPase [Armatimonadota bacterium]
MIITVSGLIASGKTTTARALAGLLGLRYLSAGEVMRRWAAQRGITLLRFSELAEQDHSIDRELDRLQVEMAREGDLVLDSRLGGWFVAADMKVWLKAPVEVRARRVSEREGIPVEAARAELQHREESERRRYREIYGIDLDDLSPYHVVLDTSLWGPEEVTEALALLARAVGRRVP